MIDSLDIEADDRVLLASIPDVETVIALSRRLERGLIVGLGSFEEVHQARKAAAELPNVMFQPGSAEEVPWQSLYFSKVIDFACQWSDPPKAASEFGRVLAEGGAVLVATADTAPFVDLGFEFRKSVGEIRIFHAPDNRKLW